MPHNFTYNEEELLLKVAEGDEDAFSSVFNYYQGKLYSVALDLTHSREDAEEIVQDVFLKVWLKKEALHQVDSFSGYLFIIMRNNALDWLTKQARRRKILSRISTDEKSVQSLTEKFFEEKEFSDLMRKALDQLPPQQQDVFRLMRQEGMTREQTAEALHIYPNTVKTHMSRALKTLRAWCIAQGEFLMLTSIVIPAIYF